VFVQSLSRSGGDKGPPAPWDLPRPAQSGLRLLLLIPQIQHLLSVHVLAARFLAVPGVFFFPPLLDKSPPASPAGSPGRGDLLQTLGSEGPGQWLLASLAHRWQGCRQCSGHKVDMELKTLFLGTPAQGFCCAKKEAVNRGFFSKSKFHKTLSK